MTTAVDRTERDVPGPTEGGRLNPGSAIERRDWADVSGRTVSVPDRERYTHLQFRRFAGCPICHLHLRSFAQRHRELAQAGIIEVVIFHSSSEELAPHVADLPFPVVADPHKRLYTEFGVESSKRSIADPRAWLAIVGGILLSAWRIVVDRMPVPSLNPGGGRFGLPADFLIASNGTVIASKYGVHADDQWSVDELLRLVPERRSPHRESPQ